MTVAVFDHPWLGALLGDPVVSSAFAAEADLAAMLRFETALAEAEAEAGAIPREAAAAIAACAEGFAADAAGLAEEARRDGVVIPGFVRRLREAVGEPHARWVHHGATSQDVIDTSLVLRLGPVLHAFDARLGALDDAFGDLDARFGGRPLMGKTRMRSALPIRAGDRIATWREPLAEHRADLARLRPEIATLQFAGAVGTLDKLGEKGAEVRARLAARLGLADPGGSWHVRRRRIGALGAWASEVSGTLGKFGADVGLMVQDEVATAELGGGGGSSAMPHKVNPVDAEILVCLARANAAALGGLHQALVHEQERSGAMWTLEWMTLPPMLAAAGGALRAAERLAGSLARVG